MSGVLRRGDRTEGPVAHAAVVSYGVVPSGEKREYEFATAYGSSDWHWAADHYRRWAYSWMKRPQSPDWARRMDGWWNIMTDTEAALLDRRSTTIFEDTRWFGLRHILHRWVHDVDLHSLPAVYDTEHKRSGKASIRMRGPLPYAYTIASPDGVSAGAERVLPISASQHLYAKPDTKYRVTAWAYTRDIKARCSLQINGKSTWAMPHNEWQQLTVEFTTPADVERVIVTLSNDSPSDLPVWFDDVKVDESAP
ncbi:MAG: hypothetical protein O3B01_32185 [Planctomycetota bacterium]|nr:hypothetical protein [Planctomycetota bacterium]